MHKQYLVVNTFLLPSLYYILCFLSLLRNFVYIFSTWRVCASLLPLQAPYKKSRKPKWFPAHVCLFVPRYAPLSGSANSYGSLTRRLATTEYIFLMRALCPYFFMGISFQNHIAALVTHIRFIINRITTAIRVFLVIFQISALKGMDTTRSFHPAILRL